MFSGVYSPAHTGSSGATTRITIYIIYDLYYRIEFHELTTVVSAENYVLHIEVDLRDENRLLFSDGCSLKSRHLDGNASMTLTGSTYECSYIEGHGTEARFTEITGFTQVNFTTILTVDVGNHCLRMFNEETGRTTQFIGKCRTIGFRDGLDALFHWPYFIMKDVRSPGFYFVTDRDNHAVRLVDIVTRLTTTYIQQWAGLAKPKNMAYDFSMENVLVTNQSSIKKFSLETGIVESVAGFDYGAFTDGPLQHSKFNRPGGLISLSQNLILIADEFNNRIRVINTADNAVQSFCTGASGTVNGTVQTCQLNYPVSLARGRENIYIGQYGAIRSLFCKFDRALAFSQTKG